MVYSAFTSSILGMMSQSQALNTISTNIANVNTGGYKGHDTRFSTMVSDSLFNESDLNGIRPWDFQRIDQQGLLAASASQMIAIGIDSRRISCGRRGVAPCRSLIPICPSRRRRRRRGSEDARL